MLRFHQFIFTATLATVVACSGTATPPAADVDQQAAVEAANKEHVRRYFETIWSQGDLSQRDSFLSPDYRGHSSANPEPIDIEAWTGWVTGFRAAFPDASFTVEDIIAEGDKVAVRLTMRGTHQGEMQGIPATGRQVVVTGMSIERVVDGRIVEGWTENDALGLLGQLGVLPPPPGQ